MESKFFLPTNVICENNCVLNHGDIFLKLGKKAAIVTGKNSAKLCGALDDIKEQLDKNKIEFEIYNSVENNPSLETVTDISHKAQAFGADFVVGIGGGSPLDASKAVSILCANPELSPKDLFLNQFRYKLPIVAVPTTAGTGSEATPYSVLLRRDLETKVSFGNELTYPDYALVDYKYTTQIGIETTRDTATDAFTHVLEGFLGKRSNPISDAIAKLGISLFGECMDALISGEIDMVVREKLMTLSLLGGIVISQAGVNSPHGMGYCYTYFMGVPHGRANGFLVKEYLKLNYCIRKDKINQVLSILGYDTIDSFADALKKITGEKPSLLEADIDKYTELSMIQKGSLGNTPYEMTREVVYDLWKKQM